MCKSEIWNKVLAAVSQETEVPEEVIAGKCKKMEVVDARYLTVHFLFRMGFHVAEIARQMQRSPQSVRGILRDFDNRRKQSGKFFEMTFKSIENTLAIN